MIAHPGNMSFPIFSVLFVKLCYLLQFCLDLLYSAVCKSVLYAFSTFSLVLGCSALTEGTTGLADVVSIVFVCDIFKSFSSLWDTLVLYKNN